MYLTRLLLNTRHAQVRRDLGNPYDMHRTLVRAFVENKEQESPRFLWRLEPQMAWNNLPVVLVQSEHQPNWGKIESAHFKTAPETKTFAFEQLFCEGQCCRFRLLANPTVCRAGKRLGIVNESEQLQWLTRQSQIHGFVVQTAVVTASDMFKARKKEAFICLQRVCYEGVLQITDIVRLQAALVNGIGHGKAFGCGLLSLARI